MRPVAPSSLTGPIGPHPAWSWADALKRREIVREALAAFTDSF